MRDEDSSCDVLVYSTSESLEEEVCDVRVVYGGGIRTRPNLCYKGMSE